MNEDFIEKSKRLHKSYEKKYWAGAFDPKEPDTARHYHMLSNALPFLNCLNPKSVLTIGDNLARDAGFIKKSVGCRVISSDLNTGYLEEAKINGFVDDILNVDVENMPFKDNFFDIVFTKESYHHWPRPNLGVYEMLRVAKNAIILIEPYDVVYSTIKPYIENEDFHDDYEESGNYKYQISLREILKISWALRYPVVAVRGFNDPYKPERSVEEWLFEKEKLDELGIKGERQFNLISICIFKEIKNVNFDKLIENKNIKLYHRPKNRFE